MIRYLNNCIPKTGLTIQREIEFHIFDSDIIMTTYVTIVILSRSTARAMLGPAFRIVTCGYPTYREMTSCRGLPLPSGLVD